MNMGYCRFQNTSADLQDCLDHFGDDDLSEDEQHARKDMFEIMFEIAKRIVEDYNYIENEPIRSWEDCNE